MASAFDDIDNGGDYPDLRVTLTVHEVDAVLHCLTVAARRIDIGNEAKDLAARFGEWLAAHPPLASDG